MGQYYDKDKFNGGGQRQPPDYSDPPRRANGSQEIGRASWRERV